MILDRQEPISEPNGEDKTLRYMEMAEVGARDLLDGARAGDGEAFAELVDPHLGPALSSAALILGSREDAADVVQDALVSAWAGLRRLRDPDAFGAWFRTQVVRAAWKAARRRKSHQRPSEELIDPVDRIAKDLAERQLWRAFQMLSVEDRLVLTLRFHLGLSTQETAEQLQTAQGTVKSRLHAALKRLRAAYDAEERQ